MRAKRIYTIGHSTRPIEEFTDLLRHYNIEMVVDVRSIPKSRRNPQFNQETLSKSLKKVGILYHPIKKLGGLRHTTKSSPNTGWRNLSFRGYADYMQKPSFWEGIDEVKDLSKKYRLALMCAEALPWRCHRSLIADALTLRKRNVFHIFNKSEAKPHTLTPFLKVKNNQIIYPKP